ncbi:MAG: hypothetical protein K2I08_05785, partial [Muribaculaceae bacterium]|nr:hypothetical protein [Muribaculaceae bacterium]
ASSGSANLTVIPLICILFFRNIVKNTMFTRRASHGSPYAKTLFLFEWGKQFAKLQKIIENWEFRI